MHDYQLPPATDPGQRSVAFVTMHKAGSTVADQILRLYAETIGLTPANFAEAARSFDVQEGEFCIANAAKVSQPGYYFGPFRGIYTGEMGGFGDNRLIVLIRDPRDCICSSYFSLGWSHRVPPQGSNQEEFLERREKIRRRSIDQYARGSMRGYLRRLNVIRRIVDAHDEVLLLKYETMVEHTGAWRAEIERFLGVTPDAGLEAALRERLDFSVDSEDPARHKRQVTPGDHQRKLEPATVALMNETLAPVLERFSYPR